MGYLPSLGTFVSRDPLGTIYPDGMNNYHAFSDNPVRYTDPMGLMPNKEDIISLDQLIDEIKKFEVDGKNPCDVLKDFAAKLQEWDEQKQKGYFWKYLGVGDPNVPGNFVDLPHFFQGAYQGSITPDKLKNLPPKVREALINGIGRQIEEQQKKNGELFRQGKGGSRGDGASYMGPEDLLSNLLGANFGMDACDCKANAAKLSDQIRNYFNKLKALSVQEAQKLPNYGMLPQTEAEWANIWENDPALWEQMKKQYLEP